MQIKVFDVRLSFRNRWVYARRAGHDFNMNVHHRIDDVEFITWSIDSNLIHIEAAGLTFN